MKSSYNAQCGTELPEVNKGQVETICNILYNGQSNVNAILMII